MSCSPLQIAGWFKKVLVYGHETIPLWIYIYFALCNQSPSGYDRGEPQDLDMMSFMNEMGFCVDWRALFPSPSIFFVTNATKINQVFFLIFFCNK